MSVGRRDGPESERRRAFFVWVVFDRSAVFRASVPRGGSDAAGVILEWWHYPVLFVVGLVAGVVDAVAGGGGLITVPALLNLGLPVPLALGTNKFQSSFGSVSASRHFLRQKVVDLRACAWGIVATAIGATAGAITVQRLPGDLLGRAIPWLLAAILIYMMCKPQLGGVARPARMERTPFFVLFGLALGFYDGFFGPGTGSFWVIALLLVRGENFTQATGATKVMNATSNLASLALFAFAGLIHLGAGLAMAGGQLIGGRLGAGLVVTRGARFVRPLFFTMVALTLARLIWVNYLE